MRLGILTLACIIGCHGVQFAIPDIDLEIAAIRRNDYVAYASLHGMDLTFHDVVTPDGWILQLWRVTSPEIYDEKRSAPVIVSHAFMASAFDYMWNLRNESTAFVLADNGYDVWLTNYRANEFSNAVLVDGNRTEPTPEDYLRSGWQYMAERDLPTIIEKVLEVTQQSKFYLIGHSMGCTITFAYLSQDHSYDDKPVFKFLLGRQLAATTGSAWKDFLGYLLSSLCYNLPSACFFTRSPHMNQTRIGIFLNKTPAGFSLITNYNFGVELNRDHWAKIDFREIPQSGLTNEAEYNQSEPTEYDFAALRVPYSLYFVDNDHFNGLQTALDTIQRLNATDYTFIKGNLSHEDAVMGFDTPCYTINAILERFEALEKQRDDDHEKYREKVSKFVDSLPFEDGCPE
ncbi:lipase member K-like [Galendromus occidentalis]|uniref:Lipase member K-like n=1 Tax=Galendromus occidentalis TaxID=34638 RepID=A0AAJ6QVV2_9ACAR|nr:lipase member K-like [Galendromus occidentalis]